MPHVAGHSPHGSGWNNSSNQVQPNHPSGSYNSYQSTYPTGSGSQSANKIKDSKANEAENEAGYMSNSGHHVQHNFSNSNNNENDNGFVSNNNSNVNDGNELSELDKIAQQNADAGIYNDALAEAKKLQEKNKKIWGLDKYAEDNLNGGKIDTSPGVVDDITELHNAAKQMAVILGLDPNNKKDLQKALNFLSGDEWGSQKKLATSENFQQIQDLKDLKKDAGGWKTWGTGLRGDSRWKGVGPLNKNSYSSALNAMAANVEAGTPAFDYHRALVNSHKPLKSDAGLLETLFSGLIPGATLLKSSGLANWLNEHNNVDKIGVDENGIFNFEYNGKKINVNDGSPFSNTEWQSFLRKENENAGGNYSTFSYDSTNEIEDPLEDIDDSEQIEEEYHVNDSYAPWYDFTLFERMFSMTGDTGQKIDLELGYGPSADKAYTAVMPKTGYIFTYDKDGNRYEVKEGEREGTIGGKTYKFKSLARLEDNEGDK